MSTSSPSFTPYMARKALYLDMQGLTVGGVLPDHAIECLCKDKGMISPYEAKLVNKDENGKRLISYGLSSGGYDSRLSPNFKVLSGPPSAQRTKGVAWYLDPKNPNMDYFEDVTADELIIQPHGFVLAQTVEYFHIPTDVAVTCIGKSTYARNGIIVHVTPLEPGWHGYVTLEISNVTNEPVKIYANEGICQFIFNLMISPCRTSYADRGGKYQGQNGIVLGRV